MKTKILDTNIMLNCSLKTFLDTLVCEEETTVIIPLDVISELDTHKNGTSVTNQNCRESIRFLNAIRKKGSIKDGIQYNELITLQVPSDENARFDMNKIDNRIIALAGKLVGQSEVELVTNDVHMEVLADTLGLKSSNIIEVCKTNGIYAGIRMINVDDNQIQELYENWDNGAVHLDAPLYTNEFVVMEDSMGNKHYGVYDKESDKVVKLKESYDAWGFKPAKNKEGEVVVEQIMLLHALLDPKIKMITAMGGSGCGKTFLALAAAMEQTLKGSKPLYDKIVVMRPLVGVDKDIGALPGSKTEKLLSWMASTVDNLEVLFKKKRPDDAVMYNHTVDIIQTLIDLNKLELEALNFIRGRSMQRQFIIIDDAQNLTPKQAATIVTRIGEGSKLILLGDISDQQIDNGRLSSEDNGLIYTVNRLKGVSPIISHITMSQTVRSELADIGVKYL